MGNLLIHGLTALSSASSLFLVAAGLTVVFGVTRVVNFAQGSLTMLGAYVAWTILRHLPRDPASFTLGVLLTAACLAVIGALIEVLLLRRIYKAPELFQLLATFGVLLMVQDVVQQIWGPDDLVLSRPPWLRAAVIVGGERFPRYSLVLAAIGPAVFALLWLLLRRTRWGRLVRAATEDREMVGALGVDQRRLFTAVFALGSALAGLAGALALPDGSANGGIDLAVVTEAFVVVVVGGMGSIPGAFLASLLISALQAAGILLVPRLTLVLVFVGMAAVLAVRPRGLLGEPVPAGAVDVLTPVRPPSRRLRWIGWAGLLLAALAPFAVPGWALAIGTEAAVAMLFAAGLHLMMGPGGMASFGHAAWFAIGAYAAALAASIVGASMPVALLLAPVAASVAAAAFGLLVVRLSGIYLAMLTLAFAQVVWALATQWVGLTGGDNGILGIWPPPGWAATPRGFYWLTVALCAAGTLLLRRVIYAPAGYALRGTRDSPARADAIGLPGARLRVAAIAVSGAAAGLAGALFTYGHGSVFPTYAAIPRSVDALLMVLLGGVGTVSGPIVGALAYTGLYDGLLRVTELWRFMFGAAIVALVLLFPEGIAGAFARRADG